MQVKSIDIFSFLEILQLDTDRPQDVSQEWTCEEGVEDRAAKFARFNSASFSYGNDDPMCSPPTPL